MAINYAEKYSAKVDEKFRLGAQTNGAVNNDYDFIGVSTVNVYSIPTVALGDYTLTGTNRYGSPSELQNTVQELTLSKDRAFTFTIDRKSYDDTQMAMEAGKALSREIDEVVIPEIDAYRIAQMADNAGTTATPTSPTKSNAYSLFLAGTEALGEKKAPKLGRIAFVTYAYYNLLKQDTAFVKASDIGQDMLVKGALGYVDGVAIIPLPTSYFPTNTYFVLTHSIATCSPVKLTEYKVHDNAPGISGWLVEGRIRYDAFVLEQKKDAIYVQASV